MKSTVSPSESNQKSHAFRPAAGFAVMIGSVLLLCGGYAFIGIPGFALSLIPMLEGI